MDKDLDKRLAINGSDSNHFDHVELTSLLAEVPDESNDVADKDAEEICSTSNCDVDRKMLDVTLDVSSKMEQVSVQDGVPSRSGSVSVRFEDILIDVLNSTTIHVDWTPLTNLEEIHGYKLRYSVKDNSSYSEVFVPPEVTSYTICGLKPNTDYDVTVNAVDKHENIVVNCGSVSQRTEVEEEGDKSTSPFIPILIAGGLLLTAVIVPVTVLMFTYARTKSPDAPYITAIVGATLLLLAAVVPITFLFMRECGKCTATSGRVSGETTTDKNDLQLHQLTSETDNTAFTVPEYKLSGDHDIARSGYHKRRILPVTPDTFS